MSGDLPWTEGAGRDRGGKLNCKSVCVETGKGNKPIMTQPKKVRDAQSVRPISSISIRASLFASGPDTRCQMSDRFPIRCMHPPLRPESI